ncbi:MAG: substrate-binding domain-containing protein [Vulcanimicrobiaceae bacterium]
MNVAQKASNRVAAVALAVAVFLVGQAAVAGQTSAPQYRGRLFPPWSHGTNAPATYKGLEFTVPEVDDMPDFHGSLNDPKLVLFVGGNYFFAMAPLVAAFERLHPLYKGRLFYVTIPPGLLVRAMRLNDTFTSGNMTFTVHPDVFAAGAKKVQSLVRTGLLQAPVVTYATNDLTIMVPKGNPGRIRSLADLGKPGVRLAMPNPAFEGVARQIKITLAKAGGPALVKAVYGTKVANGQTILTHIHHRQTPLFLMQGLAVAGITWKSEAIFQEQSGHPISLVDIPAAENTRALYGAALVRGAAHPTAGRAWLTFLQSPTALHIFERYGFKAPAHARAAVR